MQRQPTDIVDRQLAAYNARDIEAYVALFAPDAVSMSYETGRLITNGIASIREFYTKRFSGSPSLQCEIKGRLVLGNYVIDHEYVLGIGDKPVEVIAIYEVIDGLIRSLRIIADPSVSKPRT